MRHGPTVLAVMLGACLAGAPAGSPAASFERDCAELAKAPHRLTGTKEYAAAAAYVEARMKAIGADQIIVQTFPAAQTQVKRCELALAGREAPLRLAAHPARVRRQDVAYILPPYDAVAGCYHLYLDAREGLDGVVDGSAQRHQYVGVVCCGLVPEHSLVYLVVETGL